MDILLFTILGILLFIYVTEKWQSAKSAKSTKQTSPPSA